MFVKTAQSHKMSFLNLFASARQVVDVTSLSLLRTNHNVLLWPHWSQRIWQSSKDYAMFEPTYTSFSGYEKCKGLSRVEGTAAWWNVLNNVLWATTHYHGIVAEESNFIQIARGEWAAALESHLWLLTCDVILKHNYAPTMCIWFEYLDDC